MEKLLQEMRQELASPNTTQMIQNIIYFFNQPSVRDYVINHHIILLPCGKNVKWDGTYFFDENGMIDPYHHHDCKNMSFEKFIKNRSNYYKKDEKNHTFIIATCCITYEQNKVHFVSLIYDTKKKSLHLFDPGIHLYQKGQELAVPIIRNAFIKNGLITSSPNKVERLGLCVKSYYGKK